ncbi:MAG: hypothetical protein QM736_14155 [Vicinamibacterales bacterium]
MVLKRYAYTYDRAGNRTSEQIDDAITKATHDRLKRLVSQAPGGAITVAGNVNEPATVRIQGQPATVDPVQCVPRDGADGERDEYVYDHRH